MGGTSTIQEQDSRPSLVAFGNNVQKLSCPSKVVAVRSALLGSTGHLDYNQYIQREKPIVTCLTARVLFE